MRNPFTRPNIELPEQFEIATKDLTVTVDESTVALKGVTTQIKPGEFVGVVGPNGSGKSTYENIILGLGGGVLEVTGSVTYGDLDIYGQNMSAKARTQLRARHFGYVPKVPELDPDLSVRQNILRPYNLMGKTIPRDQLMETAERFGITSRMDDSVRSLSSGYKQRANVVRGLVTRPNVAVLDEPTEALDPDSKVALIDQLRSFAHDEGNTVVIVSHEATGADRLITLSGGVLVAAATEFQGETR